MADKKTCPHCGKPVPPTALGDLCPECMLQAGLATQTEGPGGTGPQGTKVVHPPPTPAEIAALFPQLEILECLGRGGMGVVYKARQPRLNRFVALKILAREKEQDAQFAERFTREAQALARLNHPNIVTVHDFGEAGGHCYLVMEFVDGLNLRQLLQARKMPSEQALAIVPKICEALQYAHEQGVVHRDIKPENILLDKSGRVKIADFGIAKMLGEETGQQTLTGARDAVGTPHYMAPEQIEKPLSVDHRADIYSLGVVFYEMLTGELPLGRFAPPSKKVQIDVRLDEVVLHALEKEPDRRYQQASQIKTAVETITAASEPGAGRRTAIKTEPVGSQNRLTPAATAFRRGAHVGLWVLLLIVFAASLITFLLPTSYLGTARVELTGLAPQSGNPYYVQTEFQVIESDSVLEGVVDSLELDQRWGKQFNGGTPLNNAEVMALMRSRIDLRPIRNTDVIEIGFFSSSPKEAAEIANKIAETYCALPPGHRGAIIERAAAPFHPIRPNVPLNIFLGIVAGSVAGIFVGLGFGLFSFWRLRAAQFEALPPAQKPDRFWRRFAIAVAAVLFALILIPIFVVLLAMFLPALNASRDRIQAIRIQNAAQQNVMTNFYIGQTWFPRGDSIEITSVERTKNQMMVKGHYNLVSHDNALLALYITTMNKIAVPVGPDERMQINKGNGDFELIDPHLVPGLPHVSMYGADGHPFASLYFGTKAEALEESKAGWITNVSSASALQFRLVLPKDSTEPADWLPSASGHERLQLSRRVLLDDSTIAHAGVDFSPDGRRTIEVRFTDAGARKFEAITATNVGRRLAIVFRGQVLSAPVIQSVIPSGECQVTGSMSANEVNEIVDCLNRTPTGSDQTWKFAAPCERILPFQPRPEFLVGWLDLDSGTVMTNSKISWQTRAGHEWIQNNSLDVVASESDQPFPVLLGIDMIIARAPTNGWESVTAADVIHNWALVQEEPQQKQVFGAMPGQSDTFLFQTREGGKGILQFLGFADNPPGVKIRYRLVRATGHGEVIDPTTGLPTVHDRTEIDPNTGLPLVNPNGTGNEIDPTTGLPITPNHTEMDPTTGLPITSPTASDSTNAGIATQGSQTLSYQWYFHDTNPPATGNRMRFGPVIERFVESSSRPPYDEYSYLDLDTGRLLSLGQVKPPVDPFNVEQFYDWRQKSGADVAAQIVNDSDFPQNYPVKLKSVFRGLVGLNTVLLPVDKSAWNNMSPQTVAAVVGPVKPDTTRWTMATTLTNGLPATHLFKTSEGGMGLLQITGFIEDPPGVQIRYKLVQAADREAQPSASVLESAELREARARLAELAVDYSEQHPAVQEALARVKALERMTKEEPKASPGLREAKAHLAELRVDYSEHHPLVQKALAEVKVLEQSNAATTNSTRP